MFNEKGEIPLSSAFKFFAVLIPVVFIIIRRDIIFDTTMDERFAIADSVRYSTAEKPLQNFNENIFKKIEFKGMILSEEYTRGDADNDGFGIGRDWLVVKLDKPIVTNDFPLKIKRIYDFTNYKKSKIYYSMNVCAMDFDNIGDSIIKKKGEIYYKLKFNKPKTDTCSIVYYTTDFDYFWTVKDLNQVLDTIPEVPIWKK